MIKTHFSRWLTFFTFAAAVALALPAKANTWPLPQAGSRLVGENKFHVVENDGGSLEAIAKKYNVGFLALLQANPGVDPYVPRANVCRWRPGWVCTLVRNSGHHCRCQRVTT